ncbi:MAG: phosphatase domain-containing protein [Nitrososphaerales archaeon]
MSFVDESVCGSARPFSRRSVLYLKEKGIDSILTLTEFPLSPDLVRNMGYKHVPINNHKAPTLEQLKESVDFLLADTGKKRKVAVHCAAGKGRTGTVLAAYLCASHGYSAKEAIEAVRAKRPGSIEKGQEAIIEEFAQRI